MKKGVLLSIFVLYLSCNCQKKVINSVPVFWYEVKIDTTTIDIEHE